MKSTYLRQFFKPTHPKVLWALALFIGSFILDFLSVFCVMGQGSCHVIIGLDVFIMAPTILIKLLLPWGWFTMGFEYVILLAYHFLLACIIIEVYNAVRNAMKSLK